MLKPNKLAVLLEVGTALICVEVETTQAFLTDWQHEAIRKWYCREYAMLDKDVRVKGDTCLLEGPEVPRFKP